MEDELQDFLSQINKTEDMQKIEEQREQEAAQEAAAQKEKEEAAAKTAKESRPLELTPLHGKVDLKWYGHSGFKLSFLDEQEIHRNIYIDLWADSNQTHPNDKKSPPNDCDLALVTHGQLDHSKHAPFLMMHGKREGRKIVCSSELGEYYQMEKKIPQEYIAVMQKGGTRNFGYCTVTMVHADHPSTCDEGGGPSLWAGHACGFVISIPKYNLRVYHMGDTNIFSDMKLIDDLYKPEVTLVPIGDCLGMGPKLAAYALTHFLPTTRIVIPMHYSGAACLTGTPEEFTRHLEEMGSDKVNVHPSFFYGGASLIPLLNNMDVEREDDVPAATTPEESTTKAVEVTEE